MISVGPALTTLKRKRSQDDNADLQADEIQLDRLPEKRTKLGSSPASPSASLTISMYKAFVKNALDEVADQNYTSINKLARQLTATIGSDDALTALQLQYLLIAMTCEIGRLDNQMCTSVIQGIIGLDWGYINNEDMAQAYIKFLAVLISGIPKWWTEVANRVVDRFESPLLEANHAILKHILQIIPTSINALQGIFLKHFPHKSSTTSSYVNYVKNLLEVTEYCSELQAGVWAIITEKLVQLDVELYGENEEDDEDEEDENEQDENDDKDDAVQKNTIKYQNPQEHEDDEDNSPINAFSLQDSEQEEYNVEDNPELELLAIRKKLDKIMCLLFDFLDKRITSESLAAGPGMDLYLILLNNFKTYVLPTHRTSTVQYIIFRTSHVTYDLLDAFLVAMIEIALSPSENIELRQKAMQYTSSFIARAKGLNRAQVVFVVSFLTSWVDKYIEEREIEVDHAIGGMARFKMFYAASQALFYVFCFRHKMLRKDESEELSDRSESSVWECDLDKLFQRMIVTKFNPLKYCRSTIVGMFASIAQRENVAYCFTVIEQNRLGGFRSSSPGVGSPRSSSGSGTGISLFSKKREFVSVEAYFPFDPLILKNAKRKLGDIFVEWSDVAVSFDSSSEFEDEDDDDDSETDSDVEAEEDEEDDDEDAEEDGEDDD